MTTFGEKTFSGQIIKGMTRHRDPMRCAIGALAVLMAFRMDMKHGPIMDEIANAATIRAAAIVPCKTAEGTEEISAPAWLGRYYIHGQNGPHQAVTANVLNKDWNEFAKNYLSVKGVQYHSLRHTHQDAATQIGMMLEDKLVSSDWNKGVMDSTYQNQGRNHDVIFGDAGWPWPWKRRHIMGRSDFTADWFEAEPWRNKVTWQPWEHLVSWQPE